VFTYVLIVLLTLLTALTSNWNNQDIKEKNTSVKDMFQANYITRAIGIAAIVGLVLFIYMFFYRPPYSIDKISWCAITYRDYWDAKIQKTRIVFSLRVSGRIKKRTLTRNVPSPLVRISVLEGGFPGENNNNENALLSILVSIPDDGSFNIEFDRALLAGSLYSVEVAYVYKSPFLSKKWYRENFDMANPLKCQ